MTAITWELTLRLQPGPSAEALTAAWAELAALPPYDPVRLEVEAQLHLFLARLAWRDADRARDRERRQARRGPAPTP